MAVLTVSREIGSGGDAIAKKVAEKCGWDLLDNEGFAAAAQTYGYVRAELEKVDERGPGLIERFFRDRQLVYLDIMRAIVFESAIKNNIVILGRGSGILLKGIPGVFRVRFIASDKVRQRRLVDQEGISVSMAEEFIRHNDQERLSYTRYFFDAMWGDPSNYDVVMNTGQMSEENAVRLIISFVKSCKFANESPASSETLKNLAYAQKIKALLMTDERIDASGISVDCPEAGRVRLHGRVNSDEEKDVAEGLVRGIDGVEDLISELVVMPPIEGWYPV